MNAWEPIAARHNLPEAPARAAFRLRRAAPADLPPPTPLVYASPHSGRAVAAAAGQHTVKDSFFVVSSMFLYCPHY